MRTRGWPLPAVVAHRCGGALAPENTLAGLDASAACGCRGVEFDVMLSADGTPFLIHDETLARTTDGHGAVAATVDAVLRRLDAGAWFAPAFAGERLPMLDEALERCAALGLAVNLELKPATGHEAATGRTVGQRLRTRWQDFPCGLVVSSFSPQALDAFASAGPAVPRALLVDAVPADWRARCAALGAIALHADTRRIDRGTVEAVRAAGLQIALYTEDDPARARAWHAFGVASVITDRPDRLLGTAA